VKGWNGLVSVEMLYFALRHMGLVARIAVNIKGDSKMPTGYFSNTGF
jgi:hypothetical protein